MTSNVQPKTVSKVAGSDVLTTSNATPTFGQSVTLTDAIPVVNGIAPTGTVSFYNGATSTGHRCSECFRRCDVGNDGVAGGHGSGDRSPGC